MKDIAPRTLLAVIACALVPGAECSAQTDIIGDRTTSKGPDFVGTNSALGNGDFQAQAATGAQPFSSIVNWFNLAGDETVNFGQSNGTNGSPQSGSLGAQLSGTTFPANDTAYEITSANQVFSVNMYLGQFGNAANYGLDTTVTVSLFTSSTGVTDTTVASDLEVLGTLVLNPFDPSNATFLMQGGEVYTTVTDDIGKTVYMGIQMVDDGNNAFPRMDVVSLSVDQFVPSPAISLVNSPPVISLENPVTTGTSEFTIRNDSSASVTVNSITGIAGTGFSIISPTGGFAIASGATQVVTVQWDSGVASPATFQKANLEINSTDTVSPVVNVSIDAGIATPFTSVLPNGDFELPGAEGDTFASWVAEDGPFSKPDRVKTSPALLTGTTAAYLDRFLLDDQQPFDAETNPFFGAEIRGLFSTRLSNYVITADFAVNSAGGANDRKLSMIVTSELSGGQNVNIRYQDNRFWARDLGGDWVVIIDSGALGGGLMDSTDGNLDGSLDDAGEGDIKVVYKIKLTGSGWGTSNPFHILEIQDSGGATIATSAPFSLWRTGIPSDGSNLADMVTFSAAFSNAPPTWVDNVAVNGSVLATSTGYAEWAAANAGGQAADLDFDNDGVRNGVEYFKGETGSTFTPNPSIIANVITWPRSPDYVGEYSVQTSPDLATWTDVPSVPSVDAIEYTLPAPPGKVFVRLRVTPD
ncbi:MAG: hypothetical protein ACSHX9_01760 [Luteolibacter sp.]